MILDLRNFNKKEIMSLRSEISNSFSLTVTTLPPEMQRSKK